MKLHFKVILALISVLSFEVIRTSGQVLLEADASTNTYARINRVLGGTAVETPDCAHTSFGPHIRQQFDSTLKRDVFAFYIHVKPDSDGCSKFDRQRNEIKTANSSPEYLKGRKGETVTLSWNFKLDSGFQPSKSFSHIHQLKDVGGSNGSPILTISPRLGSPSQLQLIHGDSKKTFRMIKTTGLAPFLGTWVHVVEKVTYGSKGNYNIRMSRVSDGAELLKYTSTSMDLWRPGAMFVRPKWGIYRSLSNPDQLRDEVVLFDKFCLAKGSDTCP